MASPPEPTVQVGKAAVRGTQQGPAERGAHGQGFDAVMWSLPVGGRSSVYF